MTWEVVKHEYVIENLGKGRNVVVCDFDSMRMMSCLDMTITTINTFLAKSNTVFYKAVESE